MGNNPFDRYGDIASGRPLRTVIFPWLQGSQEQEAAEPWQPAETPPGKPAPRPKPDQGAGTGERRGGGVTGSWDETAGQVATDQERITLDDVLGTLERLAPGVNIPERPTPQYPDRPMAIALYQNKRTGERAVEVAGPDGVSYSRLKCHVRNKRTGMEAIITEDGRVLQYNPDLYGEVHPTPKRLTVDDVVTLDPVRTAGGLLFGALNIPAALFGALSQDTKARVSGEPTSLGAAAKAGWMSYLRSVFKENDWGVTPGDWFKSLTGKTMKEAIKEKSPGRDAPARAQAAGYILYNMSEPALNFLVCAAFDSALTIPLLSRILRMQKADKQLKRLGEQKDALAHVIREIRGNKTIREGVEALRKQVIRNREESETALAQLGLRYRRYMATREGQEAARQQAEPLFNALEKIKRKKWDEAEAQAQREAYRANIESQADVGQERLRARLQDEAAKASNKAKMEELGKAIGEVMRGKGYKVEYTGYEPNLNTNMFTITEKGKGTTFLARNLREAKAKYAEKMAAYTKAETPKVTKPVKVAEITKKGEEPVKETRLQLLKQAAQERGIAAPARKLTKRGELNKRAYYDNLLYENEARRARGEKPLIVEEKEPEGIELNMMVPLHKIPEAVRKLIRGKEGKRARTPSIFRNSYIYNKTGYWLGRDGKWRYEISDQGMKLKYNNVEDMKGKKLSEVIDHPTLFDAFPSLKNTRILVDRKMGSTVSGASLPSGDIVLSPNLTPQGIEETLIHETQHQINRRMGSRFIGTNPDYEQRRMETKNALQLLRMMRSRTKHKEMVEYIDDVIAELKDDIADGAFSRRWASWIKGPFAKYAKSLGDSEVASMAEIPIKVSREEAFQRYYTSPGELEARLATYRYYEDLSEKGGKVVNPPPWKHLDEMINIEDLIDRNDIRTWDTGTKLYDITGAIGHGLKRLARGKGKNTKKASGLEIGKIVGEVFRDEVARVPKPHVLQVMREEAKTQGQKLSVKKGVYYLTDMSTGRATQYKSLDEVNRALRTGTKTAEEYVDALHRMSMEDAEKRGYEMFEDWAAPYGLQHLSESDAWKKAQRFERLLKQGREGLEHIISESTPRLPSFAAVRESKSISVPAKKALARAIKTYEVDDIELKGYLDLCKRGKHLTDSAVKKTAQLVAATRDIRGGRGKLLFPYIAPVKRLFGEKFVAPFRDAQLRIYEQQTPYLRRSQDIFKGLSREARERITQWREGKPITLTKEEQAANDRLQKVYDELWDVFGIDKYIEKYSPRVPKFKKGQDLINWVFSPEGIKEFDFWARHRRVGELAERELDAQTLLQDYIRAGFREIHNNQAIKEAAPYLAQMDKERRTLAAKWLRTVVRKVPTRDEVMVDRALKQIFRKVGMEVDPNSRYYRNLVSTLLDLNYSAFMGARPKLALRNLTQQWLIYNEYGAKAYMAGRRAAYSREIENAIAKSTVMRSRQRSYIVFEDKIGKDVDIPAEIRNVLMYLYRKADLDNCRTAFATGYLRAKALNPHLSEADLIKAGEKAVHNTQWGYGIDLPLLFKSPTGKALAQYSSWPIWYMDHVARIVKEKQGAKAARTLLQAAIVTYLAKEYGIDYTRSILFGTLPKRFTGALFTTAKDAALFLIDLGQGNLKRAAAAGGRFREDLWGFVPGYLIAKDIKGAREKGWGSLLLYTSPKHPKRKGTGGSRGH